jgi:hypothetical protein
MSDHPDEPARPLFFPVSILKLTLLSVSTFGLYELYWIYKNWSFVRERENQSILPFWRAFFAYLFCYSLFKRIAGSCTEAGIERRLVPGPLAVVWIALWLGGVYLPNPFRLASYLSFVPLLLVQAAVNALNQKVAQDHDPNNRFTRINFVWLIVAGLFSILIIFGALLPE